VTVTSIGDLQESLFESIAPEAERPDSYTMDRANHVWVRTVKTRSGESHSSSVPVTERPSPSELADAESGFDRAWLRATVALKSTMAGPAVRIVDLFAGCGAMSLGISEAVRALGGIPEHSLAVDFNARAIGVYRRNYPSADARVASVQELLDGDLGSKATVREAELRERLGEIDLLAGGPPCQGHSDLNNRTRRSDPKNTLYARMARFAEIVRPRHIIIENVPGVVHDRGRVVQETHAALHRLGYEVDTGVLHAADFGVPQRRRRFFTLASLDRTPNVANVAAMFKSPLRTFEWAAGELAEVDAYGMFDSPSPASAINRRRIDYLFDKALYELPDSERPDCHRLKRHSYGSVYGRIKPNEAVATITSGFGSMGQGRFVHPTRRRTITPHEAARLQFIPDFFDFGTTPRHALQEMIGNAVPPKLAFVLALYLLH
jgi:DNA (cytosine-5)-methyltransferase 1